MLGNRNESPEGSPRSVFGRFFSRKESKKDESPDENKTPENEESQDKNDDETSLKSLEEDPEDKKNSKILEDDEPDDLNNEFPVEDARKLTEKELDPSELTTLINDSSKEAVRSIVNNGVCDFIENSPSSTPKKSIDREIKKPSELIEDLTPTKDTSNDKSLVNSEEKKTFDSHSWDPAQRQSPRSPRTSRTPQTSQTPKTLQTSSPDKCPERTAVSQCDRSICSAYTALETEKLKKSKHKKSQKKQNISTDNRRMTGNVNIYICSEANENVKRKSPEEDKYFEDSGSESEIKSSTSASSISTSKLMDALKRKRRKKMEDLECLCEEPEDVRDKMEGSTKKISVVPDEMSSLSRPEYLNNVSSMDYLDGCSLENCPALSMKNFDNQYSSYGNDNSWDARRNSMRNYSFLPAERDVPVKDTSRKPICCSCKLPKPSRAPCACEPQPKVNSVATNYPENGEMTICINESTKNVEEEKMNENQRDGSRDEPEELTVDTNQPTEGLIVGDSPEVTAEEKKSTTGLSNEFLKKEEPTLEKVDSPRISSSDTASGDRKRESLLLRSWKRAMSIVKKPRISSLEANPSDEIKLSQERQKSKSSELKMNESPTAQPKTNSSRTLSGSQTSRKRRGTPKIVAKISSKQKQKEASQSDSKIPSISNIPKPEIVPNPQNLEKPREEDKTKLGSECGKPEEPKIVPCTFLPPEEPQSEECCPVCNKKRINCECCEKFKPQELGKCRCPEPSREPKSCICRRETCSCRPVFKAPKSYKISCRSCCNPINCCICCPPVRKCSYCGIPSDICNCKEPPFAIGRPMMPDKNTGNRGDWKSRPGIPSYFPRQRVNRENLDNCHCDQSKPYGSEELPYQKLNVFSNVMTELQQKISDSVNCNQCNNTKCCCPKSPKCLSTIAERPSSPHHNDLPSDCKCPRTKRKTTTFAVCDNCRTSPCRCRRDKRPQAKCFYCKTMPCRCNWKYEKNNEQFDDNNFNTRNTRGCRCPSPNRAMPKGKEFKPTQRHRLHNRCYD